MTRTTDAPPATSIAFCTSDPGARTRLITAIDAEGFDPLELTPREVLASPHLVTACAAFVHDLEPIGDDSLRTVRDLRAKFPTLPILLYVPHEPGTAALLLAAGRVPGVGAKGQFTDGDEVDRLRAFIQRGVADVPAVELARLLTLLLPDMPTRVAEFTFAALRRIAGPEWHPEITVGSIVPELGYTRRTLLRSWTDRRIPQPKELLDWLTLLFVTYASGRSGLSNRAVARTRGVDASAYYRLRRRLLNELPETSDERPEQEFDLALLAFAKRCHVSAHRVEALRASSGR
jgi:hypothetical protein